MVKIPVSNLDQCILEHGTNDVHGIVSIVGLLDDRGAMRPGKIGMCPQVSFGERADFGGDYGGRLYQRRFDGGIEFFGHNQFLIESLDTSIMEVAGMAGNGRSRLRVVAG